MKNEQTRQLVQAAVFFDGTGNNKTNSTNDPFTYGNLTNISNLFDACTITDRVYIEGVGTRDNMPDSIWAKATGSNKPTETGFSYGDKLQKGVDFMNDFCDAHPNDDIELFVFGFSRGATLARNFVKLALVVSNIRIKFLGIYDTVVSLAFSKPKIHFTDQEMDRMDQILHLTAINETRKYFPLTTLLVNNGSSALVNIENTYTAKVKEVFVPGAHSDLGGGYLFDAENLYLNKIKKSVSALTNDLNSAKNTVKDHFANDQHLVWSDLLGDNIDFEGTTSSAYLVTNRDSVNIDIIRVYFEVMAAYTNLFENNIIFQFDANNYTAPLNKLRDDLIQYLHTNTPVKGPNYDYAAYATYTHISANYGKIKSSSSVNQMLNTFDPDLLKEESEKAKAEHPDVDFTSITLAAIEDTLGIDLIDVNGPNNTKWQRKEIFG